MNVSNFGLLLLHGLGITIAVTISAFLFGLMLAILFTLILFSRLRVLSYGVVGITVLIRGLPELLVLFFIYFGGAHLLAVFFKTPVQINAFVAGVIGLGLVFSSYATRTLEGAFLSIPKGQVESGYALGLPGWVIFRKIMLPQAWLHSLPGIGNLWLVLLKDSALVSLIGLTDLISQAKLAAATTHLPLQYYSIAAFLFLILTSFSEWGLRTWIKRMRVVEQIK